MVRKHAKVIAEDTKIAKVSKAFTHTANEYSQELVMACSYNPWPEDLQPLSSSAQFGIQRQPLRPQPLLPCNRSPDQWSEGCLAPQVFEKHCVNAWDDDRNAWRSCFSDEHYFATVLATQGVDEVSPPQSPYLSK